jgi:uncharacterized RDD family membrane protein YckC
MESINIRTSQNVIINYQLAPLRDRFLGLFIDIIVVLAVTFLLVFILSRFNSELLNSIMRFAFFLLFLFYSLGMEVMNNGQTLGKMAAGVKVLKLDGSQPSLSDFLMRTIFHFIDTGICAGVLGGIFIATSEHKQRMGDRAANTVIVKLKTISSFSLKDILNISTTEDYEPVYTEIKNIGEQDMLVIKNALIRYRNNPSTNNAMVLNKLALKMSGLLELEKRPKNNNEFLKTLIKDYIVLTR